MFVSDGASSKDEADLYSDGGGDAPGLAPRPLLPQPAGAGEEPRPSHTLLHVHPLQRAGGAPSGPRSSHMCCAETAMHEGVACRMFIACLFEGISCCSGEADQDSDKENAHKAGKSRFAHERGFSAAARSLFDDAS